MAALSASIETRDDIPRLLINGRPHSGLAFGMRNGLDYGSPDYQARMGDVRCMARSGIRIFSAGTVLDIREDGTIDYSCLDRLMTDLADVAS